MVEEGLLDPQADVVARGGVLLGGSRLQFGEGSRLASGGAGIKQQPGEGESRRPVPAVGGGEGQGGGTAAATSAKIKITQACLGAAADAPGSKPADSASAAAATQQ